MSTDIIFPDGLMVKAPREGAPDFVKGSISIKRADLINWLGQQDGEWINLDMKVSKGGKWYSCVNTYKPDVANNAPTASAPVDQGFSAPPAPDPLDLPF